MLGETEENWRACVEKTLELEPDSVTIYQMELPFNTTISKDLLKGTRLFAEPVVNWSTKRRWVQEAFEALERAGYHVGSAYTAVKDPSRTKFVYRDRLWQGADMAGLGRRVVRPHQRRAHAEPGHVGNLQRRRRRAASSRCAARIVRPHEERMIRELVLQLKLGRIRPSYFADEVRRRHPRALPRAVRVAREAEGVPSPDGRRRANRGADARRAAARRRAAAALLPAGARRHPVHVANVERRRHVEHPCAQRIRLTRRVQFYETDAAGIVHFSWFFRYMEEAEHALWREAGLSIHPPERRDRLAARRGVVRVPAAAAVRGRVRGRSCGSRRSRGGRSATRA